MSATNLVSSIAPRVLPQVAEAAGLFRQLPGAFTQATTQAAARAPSITGMIPEIGGLLSTMG